MLLPIVAVVALVHSEAKAEEPADTNGFLYELKGGILAHDVPNMWSSFSRERGIDLNLEAIFAPKVDVLGGSIRPALGGSFNVQGDTSKIYLDARYEYVFESEVYAAVGLGGAWHNGETSLVRNDRKALGSKLLFHIPVEIGYRFDPHHGLSVYFDHVSNAYTQDSNEGMDTLGIRYGYRF
ncbi:acyloxyacyl hydrolase [Magnetospira sp. QH-2]|uniref:acyloxyacyl hydrolase n=1 Tax=Magnetospira sp. (strain QH-2) TaxID=1288970 RepID=UPI0018E098DE|nr:acyloxyacyl hydrolase [Magnetospira sp. QH-2]